MTVEFRDNNRLHPGGQCGDHWIILEIESSEDMRCDLTIGEGFTTRSDLVGERFYFGEVVCHAGVSLLEIVKSDSGVDVLRLSLGRQRSMESRPYFRQRLEGDDLGHDFVGQRSHQISLELLLLSIPEGARKVCELLLLPVLGDGDGGRRHTARRVQEVLHLRSSDLREHDGLPHE